jgi:hypothetical protein
MTSPLAMLIDTQARCVKCGKTMREGCFCWTPCSCGWTKARGADGCSRCLAVEWTKAGRSEYEGRADSATIRVYKDGIHWRSAVRLPGPAPEIDTEHRCATAKAAKVYALADAWRLGDAPSDTEGR